MKDLPPEILETVSHRAGGFFHHAAQSGDMRGEHRQAEGAEKQRDPGAPSPGQGGSIGLIKAIDNFNTDLDVKFSTYGVPMIVGEIRRYLRDNSTMRVSRAMRDTAYKVLQAKEAYMAQHQREPSIEEIAKILDIKREDVVFALDAILEPVSLYEPVYSDSGDTICVMDQVKDNKNNDEMWVERIALKEAVGHLTDRERKILSMRFFQGKTQMEVSAEIGISQAAVPLPLAREALELSCTAEKVQSDLFLSPPAAHKAARYQ